MPGSLPHLKSCCGPGDDEGKGHDAEEPDDAHDNLNGVVQSPVLPEHLGTRNLIRDEYFAKKQNTADK